MLHRPTLRWRPISALPKIACLLDSMLEDDEEQYCMLWRGQDRPHVLDDALLARVIRVYTAQLTLHRLMERRLARWERGPLTAAQTQEVARLVTCYGSHSLGARLAMDHPLWPTIIDSGS